jgi:hypothetical protein
MQEFLKVICTIVLAICVGVMIYSFVSAISTSKKNKKTDEATRKLFMAQMTQNTKKTTSDMGVGSILKQPLTEIMPSKPKALDYDKFESDEEQMSIGNKSLNDFFKK